jgi:hypothetical protein
MGILNKRGGAGGCSVRQRCTSHGMRGIDCKTPRRVWIVVGSFARLGSSELYTVGGVAT